MAEIPIERKSGTPWWLWLIVAAAVLALLIYMFSGDEAERDPVVEPVTAAAPVDGQAASAMNNSATGAAAGAVTDLALITGATGLTSMIGREVQLNNVRVQEVVGDRTFWVGPDTNQRALVVLNEERTPGQATEGRYDVTPGQIINVNGTIRNTSDAAFGSNPIEGLPAGQSAVIHADSLNIVQRP